MFDKLKDVENRFNELEKLMSNPDVFNNMDIYQKLAKEHYNISKIVSVFLKYKKVSSELSDSLELSTDEDPDMRFLAIEEVSNLSEKKEKLANNLRKLLIPKDPMDGKNVMLEIRAGTGGEEAALFAADLLKMYERYSESKSWKLEVLNYSATDKGGIKEVILSIGGAGVYSRLKYESGTHRVQRVPATETQGRIHTSAVTVAVLPEAEEIEIDIDPSDIRVDFFRSSGPGGQSVNTTDSAVRITHILTGLVVTCQDEKSQHKNKSKAMRVLRSRLLDKMISEQEKQISSNRKSQVGSGDRSERIRTYNYPQARVTDHRIDFTLYKLDFILRGELDEIIEPLIAFYQSQLLQKLDVSGV